MERAIDIALIEYWLSEWAYSMSRNDEVDGVVCNDAPWRNARRAVNEDYEGVVEDARMAGIVQALDPCIESLHPHEKWAIWRAYDQITMFPFPRLDYAATLLAAKVHVGEAMRRKGFAC